MIALCAREPALGASYTFSFLEDGNVKFLHFTFYYEMKHLCPSPYLSILPFKCHIMRVLSSCQ